jgi:hypothetical protein
MVDPTFKRIFSKSSGSKVIMAGFINAWESSLVLPDHFTPIHENSITFHTGDLFDANLDKGKHNLRVDVHASGNRENYIFELQVRREAFYPSRAFVYAAGEIISQHKNRGSSHWLKPVHTLTVVDYAFGESGEKLSVEGFGWRNRNLIPKNVDPVSHYALAPREKSDLSDRSEIALDRYMKKMLSLTFIRTPYLPRIEDITPNTPLLVKWASFISSVRPETISQARKAAGTDAALNLLLDSLDETSDEVYKEEKEAKRDMYVENREEYERILKKGFKKGIEKGIEKERKEASEIIRVLRKEISELKGK